MQVWTEDNQAIVRCDYAEKEIVKAIGDYKFDKNRKCWVFPIKKLTDIIDKLKISYGEDTLAVYNNLLSDKKEIHKKVNLADHIKSGMIINKDTEEKFIFDHPRLLSCGMEQLMAHQRIAVYLGVLFDSYALFMQTGTGKTLTAITLLKYWKKKAIIVARLSTLEDVWGKEIDKWSNLRWVNLWNNLDAINEDYDVYLINYEQFKKLHEDKKYDLSKLVEAMVVDESSKLKNNTSQITKTILSYRDKFKHKLVLTGTPAPNDLMEYWGQMAFINSDLLGENYYKFRNLYFESVGYGGFIYVPKRGAKEEIMRKIGQQALFINKEDCLELPEKVFIERNIILDELQENAYNTMLEHNILEFKEGTTVGANELAKLMKLRQITSGFSITSEGHTVLISNTKINELKDLLEEIPADQQVIVWAQFHFEIERLKAELGDECVTYYGAMSEKEKREAMDLWMNKKKRVFISHPMSGGIGLNLQQCSYMIWFSLSYSQEEFSQACDRIYRQGQRNRCTYYILLGKRENASTKKDKVIDEIIYDVLQKKQNLMMACLDMLKGKQ